MSFRDLCLKRAYSSDFDDILHDFYIPTLASAIEYRRLAGFFSSTSLAIAAIGILGLINNGGTMKLIVSPKLDKRDTDVIMRSHEEPEQYLARSMMQELEYLPDEFVRDHVFALGWMIANKKLEIKVAIAVSEMGTPLSYEEVEQSGLFHQKVGILRDTQSDLITFSGSINETAAGWLENIEEFKVFRSWEVFEKEYVDADVAKFNRFWSNQAKRMQVLDAPQAIKSKLIEIAPVDIGRIKLEKWYKAKGRRVRLFDYQKAAVNAWSSNNMMGIFEMATGTGKTYAALGCVDRLSKQKSKYLIVIACPFQHLVQQWRRAIESFGTDYDELIIADGSNPQWRSDLANVLLDISLSHKNRAITITSHRMFTSDDFMQLIKDYKEDATIFLIADEVHGLGALKSRESLIEEYDIRLGLSATPKRWFDIPGTEAIYSYFGPTVYQFTLADAIQQINPQTGESYLTPYRYKPEFISLTAEELEEYIDKTKSIAKRFTKAKADDEKDEALEQLLFKRADVIKNATQKYQALEKILDEVDRHLRWTIIYCSPQQIDKVMELVNARNLDAHRFTMDEGTNPERRYDGLSERDFILQKFTEGSYQVLVAMRCLDEGVDIPPARMAILMASSGNPREYIQRIGRIIRRYPGKSEATIHDIIVIPSQVGLPPEVRELERRIFEKELKRYEEIAKTAINSADAVSAIYRLAG